MTASAYLVETKTHCIAFEDGNRAITCLRCGMRSYNVNDIRKRYCARCHVFHDEGELVDTVLHVFMPGAVAQPYAETVRLPRTPKIGDLHHAIDPYFDRHDGTDPHLHEHVAVLYHGQQYDMFVDELGANHGLPRNVPATSIYRAAWLSTHPDVDPESLPHIAGPAVIAVRRVWS